METISSSYAKEAAEAFKYYVSINGIDDCAKKIYQYIQNIKHLTSEEKAELDLFISENTVDIEHLADITYMGEGGKQSTFNSLKRMEPYILVNKPSQNFYEARGNCLHIVKNNTQKTVKVIKRTYPKKAA